MTFFAGYAVDVNTWFEVRREIVVPPDQLAAWKQTPSGVILGDELAKRLDVKVGDRLGSFLLEALMLALIGGVIGSIAVTALSLVRVPLLNDASFSDVFAKALIFSGAMGLVGGLIPAIRASRVTPVEALRG